MQRRRDVFFVGIALALVTAACGSQNPGPASPTPTAGPIDVKADDITIVVRPPLKGDRTRLTETLTGKIKMKVRPTGKAPVLVDFEMLTREVREETALEVSGDHVILLGLKYLEKRTIGRTNGKTKDELSPVSGHSYLVQVKNGITLVTAPDGREVDEAEAKEIRREYRPVKKKKQAPTMGDLPPSTAPSSEHLHPGDRSELWEDKFREAMGGGVQVDDVDLRFIGVRGEAAKQAVFKVSFNMTVPLEKEVVFGVSMSGTWSVFADFGTTSGYQLSGPLTLAADSPKGSMQGTGTMTADASWERL